MLSNNEKLNHLAREAMEKFNALSPEEQKVHRREQRVSWVRGELRFQYPEMSYEEATRKAEEAIARVDAEK